MEVRTQHCPCCTCWRCTAQLFGSWLDEVGLLTASHCWILFLTITFSTPSYPWRRGFPITQSRPHPEFAHNSFRYFISHFETVLGERLDFAVADQFGSRGGRFHQHALLAGKNLREDMQQPIQTFLTQHVGFCRVLPFERGAAFYLSRFIGRSTRECEWDIRVGDREMARLREPERVGNVVVASADLPKSFFHLGLPGRRR